MSLTLGSERSERPTLNHGRELFGDWADTWLATIANRKPKTRESYESIVHKHLRPRFGKAPIGAIDYPIVLAYVADLRQAGVEQLAALAGKVSHGPGRVRLGEDLAGQAAWLVADRVGRAEGPMPAFDPSGLMSRDRWRTAVDVRRSAAGVLAALSFAVGVELTSSPLPRHDLVDDREVRPGRRNYLAPADVRGLPLGMWVEAGPYKRAEWLARGVAGAIGVGAFMRVNDRSYLAVYETKSGAMWRLETTGRGSHLGLVGHGESDSVDDAKRAVTTALAERFPEAAAAIDAVTTNRVVSGRFGWSAPPDGRDDRTQHRQYDQRVTAMVTPGPGGRWQTWVTVDGRQRQGPYAPDATAARTAADGLARGALLELSIRQWQPRFSIVSKLRERWWGDQRKWWARSRAAAPSRSHRLPARVRWKISRWKPTAMVLRPAISATRGSSSARA